MYNYSGTIFLSSEPLPPLEFNLVEVYFVMLADSNPKKPRSAVCSERLIETTAILK